MVASKFAGTHSTQPSGSTTSKIAPAVVGTTRSGTKGGESLLRSERGDRACVVHGVPDLAGQAYVAKKKKEGSLTWCSAQKSRTRRPLSRQSRNNRRQ